MYFAWYMKHWTFILLLITLHVSAQKKIEVIQTDKTAIVADRIVNINNQGKLLILKDNALVQNISNKENSYANVQLGNIASVNAFNPLKINVFYKDFNSVTILDNRLNEIYRIDFNNIRPYRNITHISTGYDNVLWLYNQDTQQLEIYDYKQDISKGKTLPIEDTVLDLISNYNSSWLLTETHLISYNYFGSMTSKIKNDGYTSICETNENIILKKENRLYYLVKGAKEIVPMDLPELLIKAFFATDETLYIYDGEFLHQYQLKIT